MRPCIAVETSVKEIFGLIRFLLQLNRKEHDGDMLKSVYFNFWRSRNTLSIKPSFRNPSFRRVFVRQFKRGMYELFLQEVCRKLNVGGFVFRKIVDVRRIEDIDYTLRALYGAGLE